MKIPVTLTVLPVPTFLSAYSWASAVTVSRPCRPETAGTVAESVLASATGDHSLFATSDESGAATALLIRH